MIEEKKKKIIKIGIGAIVGVALYEATALILNKRCGLGLPYRPDQITPSNALPAGALLGTYCVGTISTTVI